MTYSSVVSKWAEWFIFLTPGLQWNAGAVLDGAALLGRLWRTGFNLPVYQHFQLHPKYLVVNIHIVTCFLFAESVYGVRSVLKPGEK